MGTVEAVASNEFIKMSEGLVICVIIILMGYMFVKSGSINGKIKWFGLLLLFTSFIIGGWGV